MQGSSSVTFACTITATSVKDWNIVLSSVEKWWNLVHTSLVGFCLPLKQLRTQWDLSHSY